MSQTFAERVKELGLPLDQMIIIGSGILDQLGIRQSADIDVATNREALEEIARSDGWVEKLDKNQRQYLVKHDGLTSRVRKYQRNIKRPYRCM